MYWMCENELSASSLSNVVIWQTYIQTDTTEIIYHADADADTDLNPSSSSGHILILSSNCTFDTIVVLVLLFII